MKLPFIGDCGCDKRAQWLELHTGISAEVWHIVVPVAGVVLAVALLVVLAVLFL